MAGQSVWIPQNILESENDEEVNGFMMSLYKEAKSMDDSKSSISDISHMSICSKCSSSLKSDFDILSDGSRRNSGANTPIPFLDPTERKESVEPPESSGQLLLIQQTLKSLVSEFSSQREDQQSVASAMKRLKVHNLIEDEVLMADKEIQMNMEDFSVSVETETDKLQIEDRNNQTDISGNINSSSVITEYTDKLLKNSMVNLLELWKLKCPADKILEQLESVCTDSIAAGVSLSCMCGYRVFKLILELIASFLPKDVTRATDAVNLLIKLLENYPNEAYFFIEASGIQRLSEYLESITLDYRLFYLALLKLFTMLAKNEQVNIFLQTDEFVDRVLLMKKFATSSPNYTRKCGYKEIWPDVYMASLTCMFHILYNEDATPRPVNTRFDRDKVCEKCIEMMTISIEYLESSQVHNTASFDKTLPVLNTSTLLEWAKIADPVVDHYACWNILYRNMSNGFSSTRTIINELNQFGSPPAEALEILNILIDSGSSYKFNC